MEEEGGDIEDEIGCFTTDPEPLDQPLASPLSSAPPRGPDRLRCPPYWTHMCSTRRTNLPTFRAKSQPYPLRLRRYQLILVPTQSPRHSSPLAIPVKKGEKILRGSCVRACTVIGGA